MQTQAGPASSQPPACPAPASPASSLHPAMQIKRPCAGSLLSVPDPSPRQPNEYWQKAEQNKARGRWAANGEDGGFVIDFGANHGATCQEGREQRVLAGWWESCQVESDEAPSTPSPTPLFLPHKSPPTSPSPSFAPPRCLMWGERITPLGESLHIQDPGFCRRKAFPMGGIPPGEGTLCAPTLVQTPVSTLSH